MIVKIGLLTIGQTKLDVMKYIKQTYPDAGDETIEWITTNSNNLTKRNIIDKSITILELCNKSKGVRPTFSVNEIAPILKNSHSYEEKEEGKIWLIEGRLIPKIDAEENIDQDQMMDAYNRGELRLQRENHYLAIDIISNYPALTRLESVYLDEYTDTKGKIYAVKKDENGTPIHFYECERMKLWIQRDDNNIYRCIYEKPYWKLPLGVSTEDFIYSYDSNKPLSFINTGLHSILNGELKDFIDLTAPEKDSDGTNSNIDRQQADTNHTLKTLRNDVESTRSKLNIVIKAIKSATIKKGTEK